MNMLSHFPVYQVIIPILAAFAIIFVPVHLSYYLVILSVCVLISLNIYGLGILDDSIRYYLGGWSAPVGIEYKLDYLNQPLLLVISLMLLYTMLSVGSSCFSVFNAKLNEEDGHSRVRKKQNIKLFYFLLLILHAGVCGIVATNDLFNLYVFIEIASLATYVLLAISSDKRALIGSVNYLIIGTVGASFILLGVGLVLTTTGSLNFDDVAARMPSVIESKITILGIASFVAGCLLKMALFPLHSWMIKAYRHATAGVLTYIAPVSSIVSSYMLIRFIYFVCDINYLHDNLYFGQLMASIGTIAVILTSYRALKAQTFRDVVLYSAAAQIGYMTMCFAVNSSEMMGVIISFALADILTKVSLFIMVIGVEKSESESLEDGIYPSRVFMLISIIVILSNAAIPLSLGFVNKINILTILMNHSYYLPAIVMVATSILALEYNYKLLKIIYVAQVKEHYLIALWPALISYLVLFYNQDIIKTIGATVS